MSSLFCGNPAPDFAILYPPMSNFVREMYNSRYRLRPLMHCDDAKVIPFAPQTQPQKTTKAMKAKPKKTMKAMKAKNTKTSMNAKKTQKAMKKKGT
jgi:hypothetical protein